jgi:hypothetical protein
MRVTATIGDFLEGLSRGRVKPLISRQVLATIGFEVTLDTTKARDQLGSEGYTSSLAAAALQDLGLHRATDMVGGFQAWRATGLTIVPPSKAFQSGPADEWYAQFLDSVGMAADTNSRST